MPNNPMPEGSLNRKPMMEFIGEFLYCDGVKVQPWQLTEEEIRRHVPKSHWGAFFRGKLPCPFDDCLFLLENGANLKRAWTQHVRNAHREWYKIHGEKMQECTDYKQLVAFVTVYLNADESRMDT